MKVIRLFLCLFISLFVFGCDEGTEYKYFEVKNESALKQTVYVGDTQASMPIEFTTSGPWTSKVEYSTIDASTGRTETSSSGWVTLNPSSGDSAGEYSVNICLNPENGKNVYMAIISFICNGEVLEVTLENSFSLNPGDSDDVRDPEKIEKAKQKLEAGFTSVENAFLELDKNYSTPESRVSLNSNSKILEDFWFESYDAINTCNLLLYACDLDIITDYDKGKILVQANRYRGLFHFYLSCIFGYAPIQSSYPLDLKAPGTEKNYLMEFVINDMDKTINSFPIASYYYDDVYLIKVLAYALLNESLDSNEFRDNLKYIMDNNIIGLDTNGDGIVNSSDYEDYPIAVQCYLLSAYAESDYNLEVSKYRMNYLAKELKDDKFEVENSASPEDVKAKVKEILSTDWGRGIRYLVNRFMFDYNWDYMQVLPLPLKALVANENLKQNPGWQ